MRLLRRPTWGNWTRRAVLLVFVMLPAPSVWPSSYPAPDVQTHNQETLAAPELKQTRYYVALSEGEAMTPQTVQPAAEALEGAMETIFPSRVPGTTESAWKFKEKDCPDISCEVVTEEVKHEGVGLLFVLHVKLVKPAGLKHPDISEDESWPCPVGGDDKEKTCWKLAPKKLAKILHEHDEKVHQQNQGNP